MKLSGFRLSHRNRWQLITHKILHREDLFVFEMYLDAMVFDQRKLNFGEAKITLKELAHNLGYSSASMLSASRKKLVKLGFLIPTLEKSTFKVCNPQRYFTGKVAIDYAKSEPNKSVTVMLNNVSSLIQPTEDHLQPSEKLFLPSETQLQPTEVMAAILAEEAIPKLTGSFKVNSSVQDHIPQSITENQLEQTYLDDQGLPSRENAQLINEAIASTKLIPSS